MKLKITKQRILKSLKWSGIGILILFLLFLILNLLLPLPDKMNTPPWSPTIKENSSMPTLLKMKNGE